MGIALVFRHFVCFISLSHSFSQSKVMSAMPKQVGEPKSHLIITNSNIFNMINKGSLNHEKLEKQEFDALLTETANAFRKADQHLLKKLVVIVDRVGNIERSRSLPPNLLKYLNFRDLFIATTIEWFHLLMDTGNEDIIRSKLKGLNKNLFLQFRKNRDLVLKLISRMIGKTVAAGLTAEEQMILFNLVVESGAIEKIKSIALHEMALQLGTNVPEDHSILKTIADLMVEKVFEAKYHEIEKNFIHENEIDSSLEDLPDCEDLKCTERHANKMCPRKCGKHANLKVDLLKSNKAFDNIHKKSTNQADDVRSINILLQTLRSRPLIRQSRSARWHKTEDDEENEEEKESSNENLEEEKKSKHSFKTRIHGDNKGKMIISQVPIRKDETDINEVDNGNVDEKHESGKSQEETDGEEKIQIITKVKEENRILEIPPNHHSSDESSEPKSEKLTELDITKEFIPKFQKIYSDESTDSKEKDRQMIRLITDMMSDPRIQASVIRMLEKYLQGTDVRKATHFVLMAMERTSFGSGEDVLEEMFATWEPFLSKAIELLSIEGLAKVCAIHAAVEKVAKPHQQITLRQLRKKIINGLSDRQMAQRLSNGMEVALHGSHEDILDALQKDPKVLKSEKRAKKLKEKLLSIM